MRTGYTQSLATLVMYWRLAGSSITVTSSVTCYVGDIITRMMQFSLQQHRIFVTRTSDTRKSTSPSESQVKNWQKAISTEKK